MASVVGPLDPGDDRDAQLLAGGPGASVEDVLLQQAEERFHSGVVARGANSAHGPDHAVTGQGTNRFPGAKMAVSWSRRSAVS